MSQENTDQNGSHESSRPELHESSIENVEYGVYEDSHESSIPKRRVAVVPFIAALDYDAEFHARRGEAPPPVVPEAAFRKAVRQRTIARVWGTALMLLVGGLLVRTAIYAYTDTRAYIAGQPQHIETSEDSVNAPTVIIPRVVPSMYPLPADWERATLFKYTYLLLGMGVCSYLGITALYRAQNIETGVPDTEQLPLVEIVAYLPSELANPKSPVPPRPDRNGEENPAPRSSRPPAE